MNDEQFSEALLAQMRSVPALRIGPESRIAILSDLHMGDGSSHDDLRDNGELVAAVLDRYYFARGSTLVLNGDVEDLQKFPLKRIRAAWGGTFALFDRFAREGRFHKIYGNHDEDLLESSRYPYPLQSGLRLEWGRRTLYAYHGHQASGFFVKHNAISGAVIRYVFHTLGIRNRSPSQDSNRRYGIERKIYEFSARTGIVSLIGHTHRPLFESLSKYDRLRYEIERLCLEYCEAGPQRRAEIEGAVALLREEFGRMGRRDRRRGRGLYGRDIILPCLFNSGSAVGKKGVTTIEIEGDRITLAYWFEEGKARPYLALEAGPAAALEGSRYRRVSLASKSLADVFARMDLLSRQPGGAPSRPRSSP
jgi:predicted phosphodiesterase